MYVLSFAGSSHYFRVILRRNTYNTSFLLYCRVFWCSSRRRAEARRHVRVPNSLACQATTRSTAACDAGTCSCTKVTHRHSRLLIQTGLKLLACLRVPGDVSQACRFKLASRPREAFRRTHLVSLIFFAASYGRHNARTCVWRGAATRQARWAASCQGRGGQRLAKLTSRAHRRHSPCGWRYDAARGLSGNVRTALHSCLP